MDTQGGMEETVWCEGCRKLKKEVTSLQEEHAINYQTLKQKIISTDLLIRKYRTKCEEYDNQNKRVEELSRRLDRSTLDCEMLETQLRASLQSTEPLKQARVDLENQLKAKDLEVKSLQNSLDGAEMMRKQFEALIAANESALNEDERKQREKRLQNLESTNARYSRDLKAAKDEVKSVKSDLTRTTQQYKGLRNRLAGTLTRLETYWTLLKENGLLPHGDRKPKSLDDSSWETSQDETETELDRIPAQEKTQEKKGSTKRKGKAESNQKINKKVEISNNDESIVCDSVNFEEDDNIEEFQDDDDDDECDDVEMLALDFKFTFSPICDPISPLPVSPAPEKNYNTERTETPSSVLTEDNEDSMDVIAQNIESQLLEKAPFSSLKSLRRSPRLNGKTNGSLFSSGEEMPTSPTKDLRQKKLTKQKPASSVIRPGKNLKTSVETSFRSLKGFDKTVNPSPNLQNKLVFQESSGFDLDEILPEMSESEAEESMMEDFHPHRKGSSPFPVDHLLRKQIEMKAEQLSQTEGTVEEDSPGEFTRDKSSLDAEMEGKRVTRSMSISSAEELKNNDKHELSHPKAVIDDGFLAPSPRRPGKLISPTNVQSCFKTINRKRTVSLPSDLSELAPQVRRSPRLRSADPGPASPLSFEDKTTKQKMLRCASLSDSDVIDVKDKSLIVSAKNLDSNFNEMMESTKSLISCKDDVEISKKEKVNTSHVDTASELFEASDGKQSSVPMGDAENVSKDKEHVSIEKDSSKTCIVHNVSTVDIKDISAESISPKHTSSESDIFAEKPKKRISRAGTSQEQKSSGNSSQKCLSSQKDKDFTRKKLDGSSEKEIEGTCSGSDSDDVLARRQRSKIKSKSVRKKSPRKIVSSSESDDGVSDVDRQVETIAENACLTSSSELEDEIKPCGLSAKSFTQNSSSDSEPEAQTETLKSSSKSSEDQKTRLIGSSDADTSLLEQEDFTKPVMPKAVQTRKRTRGMGRKVPVVTKSTTTFKSKEFISTESESSDNEGLTSLKPKPTGEVSISSIKGLSADKLTDKSAEIDASESVAELPKSKFSSTAIRRRGWSKKRNSNHMDSGKPSQLSTGSEQPVIQNGKKVDFTESKNVSDFDSSKSDSASSQNVSSTKTKLRSQVRSHKYAPLQTDKEFVDIILERRRLARQSQNNSSEVDKHHLDRSATESDSVASKSKRNFKNVEACKNHELNPVTPQISQTEKIEPLKADQKRTKSPEADQKELDIKVIPKTEVLSASECEGGVSDTNHQSVTESETPGSDEDVICVMMYEDPSSASESGVSSTVSTAGSPVKSSGRSIDVAHAKTSETKNSSVDSNTSHPNVTPEKSEMLCGDLIKTDRDISDTNEALKDSASYIGRPERNYSKLNSASHVPRPEQKHDDEIKFDDKDLVPPKNKQFTGKEQEAIIFDTRTIEPQELARKNETFDLKNGDGKVVQTQNKDIKPQQNQDDTLSEKKRGNQSKRVGMKRQMSFDDEEAPSEERNQATAEKPNSVIDGEENHQNQVIEKIHTKHVELVLQKPEENKPSVLEKEDSGKPEVSHTSVKDNDIRSSDSVDHKSLPETKINNVDVVSKNQIDGNIAENVMDTELHHDELQGGTPASENEKSDFSAKTDVREVLETLQQTPAKRCVSLKENVEVGEKISEEDTTTLQVIHSDEGRSATEADAERPQDDETTETNKSTSYQRGRTTNAVLSETNEQDTILKASAEHSSHQDVLKDKDVLKEDKNCGACNVNQESSREESKDPTADAVGCSGDEDLGVALDDEALEFKERITREADSVRLRKDVTKRTKGKKVKTNRSAAAAGEKENDISESKDETMSADGSSARVDDDDDSGKKKRVETQHSFGFVVNNPSTTEGSSLLDSLNLIEELDEEEDELDTCQEDMTDPPLRQLPDQMNSDQPLLVAKDTCISFISLSALIRDELTQRPSTGSPLPSSPMNFIHITEPVSPLPPSPPRLCDSPPEEPPVKKRKRKKGKGKRSKEFVEESPSSPDVKETTQVAPLDEAVSSFSSGRSKRIARVAANDNSLPTFGTDLTSSSMTVKPKAVYSSARSFMETAPGPALRSEEMSLAKQQLAKRVEAQARKDTKSRKRKSPEIDAVIPAKKQVVTGAPAVQEPQSFMDQMLKDYLTMDDSSPDVFLKSVLEKQEKETCTTEIFNSSVKILKASQVDQLPVMYSVCCEDKELEDTFLTGTEIRVLDLLTSLLQLHEESPRHQLMEMIWTAIFLPCMSTPGRMALCRMFTALCRSEGDLEQVRVFIFKLMTCGYISYVEPVLSVVGVWPLSLKPGFDTCALLDVIQYIILNVCQSKTAPESIRQLSVCYQRLCEWTDVTVWTPSQLLDSCVSKLKLICADCNHERTFETMKSIELLLWSQDWKFCYNEFCCRHLSSVCDAWKAKGDNSTVNIKYMMNLSKIFSNVYLLPNFVHKHKEFTNAIKRYFIASLDIRTEHKEIHMCMVEVLRELSPRHPHFIMGVLAEWYKTNREIVPPDLRDRLEETRKFNASKLPNFAVEPFI